MKIAITSDGKNLDAAIDPRFGRAKWFILYDLESDQFEAVDNAHTLNLPQGAGIQAAQKVSDHDAEVVITGHCGPKAFETLSSGGIKVCVGVSGSVKQAIEQYKSGAISPVEKPNVEGHW